MQRGFCGRRVLDAGIDECWLAIEYDGRSAETTFAVCASGCGSERDRLMFPVDHVGADGMAPVHVTPHGGMRIELIEEMVLALPPDGTVGIVHPVVRREEMIFRTEWIVSNGGKLIVRRKLRS